MRKAGSIFSQRQKQQQLKCIFDIKYLLRRLRELEDDRKNANNPNVATIYEAFAHSGWAINFKIIAQKN